MGRTYAGVLGCLAFAAVLAHGIFHAGGFDATVGRAAAFMSVFGMFGFVIGTIAQAIVEESVRAQMALELAARAEESQKDAPPAAKA